MKFEFLVIYVVNTGLVLIPRAHMQMRFGETTELMRATIIDSSHAHAATHARAVLIPSPIPGVGADRLARPRPLPRSRRGTHHARDTLITRSGLIDIPEIEI